MVELLFNQVILTDILSVSPCSSNDWNNNKTVVRLFLNQSTVRHIKCLVHGDDTTGGFIHKLYQWKPHILKDLPTGRKAIGACFLSLCGKDKMKGNAPIRTMDSPSCHTMTSAEKGAEIHKRVSYAGFIANQHTHGNQTVENGNIKQKFQSADFF